MGALLVLRLPWHGELTDRCRENKLKERISQYRVLRAGTQSKGQQGFRVFEMRPRPPMNLHTEMHNMVNQCSFKLIVGPVLHGKIIISQATAPDKTKEMSRHRHFDNDREVGEHAISMRMMQFENPITAIHTEETNVYKTQTNQ